MAYQPVRTLVSPNGESVAEVVEDDDGFRLLLVDHLEIPDSVLRDALNEGVGLVVCGPHAVTPEDLVAGRPAIEVAAENPWVSYRDYVDAREALDNADPLEHTKFVHLHTHTEYCLAPETRVCTADLKWKPIGEVTEGEQLVGFDEDLRAPEGQRGNSRSKMRRTTVTGVKRVVRDCYRIRLEDGTEIISSAEHGWVVNGTARGSQVAPGGPEYGRGGNSRRWLKTKDLMQSPAPGWVNRDVAPPNLILWAKPWDPEVPSGLEREAGWLAGIADGEGWLASGVLSLGQNPGLVMDEMHRVCKALGYETTKNRVQSSKGVCETFSLAGYEATLRFMAQCHPTRFVGRTDECWVGKRAGSRYTKAVPIQSVEHLGEMETIAISTTTKTFVAEGFLSHNSQLDGLSTLEEIAQQIVADPNLGGALPAADHGTCAGHPEVQEVADKYGLRPVFGMEAYFVDNRHRRTEFWHELDGVRVDPEHLTTTELKKAEKKNDSIEVKNEYTHLTLWAMDDAGLRNLWAMSTEAYRDGLYDGKPRLDWETLERLNEGVLCGTGCLRGPVSRPLIDGDVETARQTLMRLHRIFDDRLYIEIHVNSLEDQVKVNHHLEQFSLDYKIPPIAAVDSHYSVPEHKVVHEVWFRMQTGKSMTEDTTMFSGNQDYHLKSVDEVVEALIRQGFDDEFIHEAVSNTVEVAGRCTAQVVGAPTTPTYSKTSKEHPDPVRRDVERLVDICLSNWGRKVDGKRHSQQEYMDRFEREMALLKDKGFCGYFLVVWDYVSWAKKNGCLVGPGRGSGGGSLVAYLADIVEVDPVDADLIFERFLTEGRKSLPDFDIDFPTSWRGRITNYIIERWGEEYVAHIGTVTRLRSKQAINDVLRVLDGVAPVPGYKEVEALKKNIDEADRSLAGKHLPWDEFCAQYADVMDPMLAAYPEFFAAVDVVMNRVKTYGKHAAGEVISTNKPLTDLPMRLVEDKNTKTHVMVTQFDMVALDNLGYVKFDFLTLRTLDTLQVAMDLIEAKYEIKVNPYDWREEYDDPQVWEEVSAGRTLGLFQIETASGTRLTKRMQPQDVYDLAAVMTVVRPGPMRSGLTESYLRRRAGLEPITYLDPRLESFLGNTYGSMIYQEQVMAVCMNLAGYDSTEADVVRKILGKKQVEKVKAAGEEFVERAVQHGTTREVADTLWTQMAEFAKYGFNKAHAFGYSVLGYWCAFLRFHYPVEFLVAALSTVDKDRIPEFIEDCRNCGYIITAPDINRSQVEFTANGMEVIYGLSEIKGIGEPAAQQIVSMAPYTDFDNFIERCVKFTGSKVNMGHVKTLVEVGAFDSIVPNRRAMEIQLGRESSGEAKKCIYKIEAPNPEHKFNVPCSFDWPNEPDPPTITRGRGSKKVLIPKDPPKKCTIACRQYTPPPPVDASEVTPYSSDEIMRRERELLGVWISYSPFHHVPEDFLDASNTAREIEAGPAGTNWEGVGLVEEVKKRKDVNGNDYAFVKINLQDGVIEMICFASVWENVGEDVTRDRLCWTSINKTPKGYQLAGYAAIN